MKHVKWCIFFPFLLVVISCVSGPKIEPVFPPEEPPLPQPVVVVPTPPPEAPPPDLPPPVVVVVEEEKFDPASVTAEVKDFTMAEVRRFIGDLNGIIGSGNFTGWKSALAPEYFARISSREFLNEINDQPAMKTQRKVLRDAQDYFREVVMPSRANSRVDDIEFVEKNRVKAYTINNRSGERLVLYDLEQVGTKWFIKS